MNMDAAKAKREAAIRDNLPAEVKVLADAANLRPGALFEPDARALLEKLRADNPAAWLDARALFKAIPDVPIGELDRMTAPAGGEGDGKQGRPVEWDDPVPCPDPVDGAALLSEIAASIRRYVWLDAPVADALALWTVMTWVHDRFEISTFANLTSATKRCGKFLLVEVLGELVYRPMALSGHVTAAALFRILEAHAPTLMLDEADTYTRDDETLRGVVNGSQRRALAYISRCVEPDNEVRNFATFCPKLIAGIGRIPDTVRDRSLVMPLTRKPAAVRLDPWRERDREAVAAMRGQIARWTRDNAGASSRRYRRWRSRVPCMTVPAMPGNRCSPSRTRPAASGPDGTGAPGSLASTSPRQAKATKAGHGKCCSPTCTPFSRRPHGRKQSRAQPSSSGSLRWNPDRGRNGSAESRSPSANWRHCFGPSRCIRATIAPRVGSRKRTLSKRSGPFSMPISPSWRDSIRPSVPMP